MHTKIQEIHNGKLFGIFSETGCSGGLANTLMNESGSSHTVDFSIQPYNKNREVERYGKCVEHTAVGREPMWERSVSIHYVDRVLEIEQRNMLPENNFIFASSWQLDGICHGWIGLYLKETNTKHYLHYTLPTYQNEAYSAVTFPDRKSKLDYIARIGVELLHSATYDPTLRSFKLKSNDLYPAVLDMAYLEMHVDYDLVIGSLESCIHDYPVVFEKEGMIRLEDLARRSKNQVIVKGSFNPMHHAHKDMAEMTKSMYPGSVASLLISTARYDKPHIGTDELIDRIRFINEHGYPLIVVKEIFFYKTFKLMSKWMPDHNFYWPVGTDTLNRIYEADKKEEDEYFEQEKDHFVFPEGYLIKGNILKQVDNTHHMFVHYNRSSNGILEPKVIEFYSDHFVNMDGYVDTGVSSTKIRSGEMKNDIDQE